MRRRKVSLNITKMLTMITDHEFGEKFEVNRPFLGRESGVSAIADFEEGVFPSSLDSVGEWMYDSLESNYIKFSF